MLIIVIFFVLWDCELLFDEIIVFVCGFVVLCCIVVVDVFVSNCELIELIGILKLIVLCIIVMFVSVGFLF